MEVGSALGLVCHGVGVPERCVLVGKAASKSLGLSSGRTGWVCRCRAAMEKTGYVFWSKEFLVSTL